MKAVVLVANHSERLDPFTKTRPKPMMRIAGKYILDNTVEYLRDVGIRDIILVVNYQKEMIQQHFGHGDQHGVNIEYVFQESLDGIGSAVKLCKPLLHEHESFLLVYGDVLSDGNLFQNALKSHYELGEDIAVVALPTSSEEYGNVYLDHLMKINRLVEKPQAGQQSNYVFAGAFIFSLEIFDRLESCDYDMEHCFHMIIREKGLQATIWEDEWIDIIYPWHILEANKMMMNLWTEARIHHTVKMNGKVQIDGPVFIDEKVVIESGTILKGPCYIGKNSYIGNNTLIRSYSVLGPNSVIGYGCELKNCVLFGTSTIGRLSFIGDSVVGENVSLGSGTTTVNHWPEYESVHYSCGNVSVNSGMSKLGAFIGDKVIIGARHTLPPGAAIEPNLIIPDNISLPSNK